MSMNKTKCGFMMIMVLVTIAIGIVIYAMMMGAVLPEFWHAPRAEQAKVWDEEWRLEPNSPERMKAAKKMAKYVAAKPQITKEVTIGGDVILNTEPRGKLTFVLMPGGKVKGTWISEYAHGNIQYSIKASFAGVTDPTNMLVEGGQNRPEQLYYITRGNYVQKSLDTKNDQESTEEGIAFAAGWLGADMASRGDITLTTDRRGATIYIFTAARQPK
jgi:hypothetical protein